MIICKTNCVYSINGVCQKEYIELSFMHGESPECKDYVEPITKIIDKHMMEKPLPKLTYGPTSNYIHINNMEKQNGICRKHRNLL